MDVRILYDGEPFATYNEDTYENARTDILEQEGSDPDLLSIHPEDVVPLGRILDKRRIDRLLRQSGANEREVRIWTSNLATLNMYFTCLLLKAVAEGNIGDNTPANLQAMLPMATEVINAFEGGDMVAAALGSQATVDKMLELSEIAKNIVVDVTANPTEPTI